MPKKVYSYLLRRGLRSLKEFQERAIFRSLSLFVNYYFIETPEYLPPVFTPALLLSLSRS